MAETRLRPSLQSQLARRALAAPPSRPFRERGTTSGREELAAWRRLPFGRPRSLSRPTKRFQLMLINTIFSPARSLSRLSL
jgi:hypothetical protein